MIANGLIVIGKTNNYLICLYKPFRFRLTQPSQKGCLVYCLYSHSICWRKQFDLLNAPKSLGVTLHISVSTERLAVGATECWESSFLDQIEGHSIYGHVTLHAANNFALVKSREKLSEF